MSPSRPLVPSWPAARPSRALAHARPREGRILYHNVWYRTHNNARYAQLLPRLDRLDPYLFACSANRIVAGVESRLIRSFGRVQHSLIARLARGRYNLMLSTNVEQAPFFQGRVVVDIDDPLFSVAESRALSHSGVVAYVVTSSIVGRRFEALGVQKPFVVIPQGVALSDLDEQQVTRISRDERSDRDVVFAYAAPFLRAKAEVDDDPLYGLNRLLPIWDEFVSRVPSAQLWLVGQPDRTIASWGRGRPDITMFGYRSNKETLNLLAAADVGLYPRPVDAGIASVKIAQYLALGLPTITYDVTPAEPVRQADAGMIAGTDREFLSALERLATSPTLRKAFAEKARVAGKLLDWHALAGRYQLEVLDAFLT